MTPKNLSEWILRVLQIEGPQGFLELMALLKSDPEYGYISLRDPQFEAKVRSSLLDNSGEKSQLFVQSFDYKWHAFRSEKMQEMDGYLIPRNKPWLELGHGPEIVYGIFFPSTLRESVFSQTASYPVKIGRTTRPLGERLFELQTGNFLDLQIGLAIHTHSASTLESNLHEILGHRKIHGTGSQSEWFLTSLENVAIHCKAQLASLGART
jgi:hypothetical protein